MNILFVEWLSMSSSQCKYLHITRKDSSCHWNLLLLLLNWFFLITKEKNVSWSEKTVRLTFCITINALFYKLTYWINDKILRLINIVINISAFILDSSTQSCSGSLWQKGNGRGPCFALFPDTSWFDLGDTCSLYFLYIFLENYSLYSWLLLFHEPEDFFILSVQT